MVLATGRRVTRLEGPPCSGRCELLDRERRGLNSERRRPAAAKRGNTDVSGVICTLEDVRAV
ncbi:hypothetical protein D8S78_07615 [Natrialba swarupiae]|nr:hypothetical protein [Natrialba swarupiae]